MRVFWIFAGYLSLALGLIGAALPVLPTVPLVLLAAFCFARSSPRLHDWLLSHPVFGPHIQSWRERGAINPRAKWLATISMAASLIFPVAAGLPPLVIGLQAAILTAVGIFIWSRPPA